MKKIYFKPAVREVAISRPFVLAGSTDAIPPGPPNQPAGARRFGSPGYDDCEDEEDEQ